MAAEKKASFRILASDPVAPEGLKILRETPGFEVEAAEKMSPEALKKAVAGADALVVRSETKVTAEVIAAAPRLKVVGRAGVGIDNVDVTAATKRGILVMNAPEGNTIAAAEHAMALLLALSRNVPWAHASLSKGEWKRSAFIGRELFGKVLGLVGLGRIGGEVAKRARAFGMTVMASDPLVSPERAREMGAELVPFKDLLARADYISLHAALTPETRHMLGAAEFSAMKRGVRLVNCARGPLIDEAALAAAVKEGKVGGAALDVFEKEPPDKGNPLLGLERVVVTPHLGASTEEAQVNVSVVIAEQVRDYLLHGTVRNAVNAPSVPPEVLAEMGPYMDLAERMGRFLIQLAGGRAEKLEVRALGDISRRNTALLTSSAVCGALSAALGEGVNSVNAMSLAKERGIEVSESRSTESREFSSVLELAVVSGAARRTMQGVVIGKREPHVVSIDGLHLDIVPDGHMLIFTNVDRPGIVGKVGTILGKARVNIAGLHLGRMETGKRSVSIFSVDDPVPPAVLKELSALEDLADVTVVSV
jgi:D-3-phosphoglycerate dehydrogenase